MSATGEFNIRRWLAELGLEQYASAFEENHVTSITLAELTDGDLRELGVTSLGHRKQLLAEIRQVSLVPGTRRVPKSVQLEHTPPPEPESKPEELPARVVEAPHAPEEKQPASVRKKPVVILSPPAARRLKSEASSTSLANPESERAESSPEVRVFAEVKKTPSDRAEKAPPRKTIWKRILASKILVGSIAVHLLFGLGATYFIVQHYTAKRKTTFQGGPPAGPNPSKRALEHKVSMAQKKKTGGAPPQAKRIATAGIASISLPDMPTLSSASTVVPGMKSGMGGMGFGMGMGIGSGMGSGMAGGMGGGGSGMTLFGFRGTGGLVGTFYDFKRDSSGKATGMRATTGQAWDRPTYTRIIKEFVTGGEWKVPTSHKHYTSPVKLSAKAFFFPAIHDTEAGTAFQAKDTGPGMWIAHYTGTVTSPVSGTYRLVAWGDNVMIVGINNRVVMDASDIGYTGQQRTAAGVVAFAKKSDTPMFEGSWFDLSAGQSYRIDILVGDEGGIYCAGAMLQKKGDSYGRGKGGIPELPLWLFGALGDAEKKLYREYVDDKAFSGPVFNARGGTGSLLDSLKR